YAISKLYYCRSRAYKNKYHNQLKYISKFLRKMGRRTPIYTCTALRCPQEILNQKNASILNDCVSEKLTQRLGVVEAYMAKVSKKEPFPDPQIHVSRKLSRHRYSNRGKTGHNSRNLKK